MLGVCECDEVIWGVWQLCVRIGVDEYAQGAGGLFCFLKYNISWFSSFPQQKVGKL